MPHRATSKEIRSIISQLKTEPQTDKIKATIEVLNNLLENAKERGE